MKLKMLAVGGIAAALGSVAFAANATVYDFSYVDGADHVTGTFTTNASNTVVSGSAAFTTTALGDFTAPLAPGSGSDGSFIWDNKFPVDNPGLLFEIASTEINIFTNPGVFAGVGVTSDVNFYAGPIASGSYPIDDPCGILTIAAAPEPAAWALMLIGIGGLGAALRSTRRLQVAAI